MYDWMLDFITWKGLFMAKGIRLDKFLSDMTIGTRSEVKIILKRGRIAVNGVIQKSPDLKIDPDTDLVSVDGTLLKYQSCFYYMLHKPAGVITATEDANQLTVMQLLGDDNRNDLFPVGRLDKDTEGFLLITNDGALAHDLLSPKKHVPKTYLVEIPSELSEEQMKALEDGVDIGDDKLTLPAKVNIVCQSSPTAIILVLKL